MKKSLFLIILLLVLLFPLTSCGEIEEPPVTPDLPQEDKPTPKPNPDGEEEGVEFCVSLVYEGMIYIPSGEEITVIWADDYSQYSKSIDNSGYAKILLDGDFQVYLDNVPSGYTYDPNIYFADNENSTIEIELLKIYKISKGRGTGLYNEYQVSTTGTYRTTIASKTKKVYYEYQPTKSGVYSVESLVNVKQDLINPKLDIYSGTFAYKNFDETIDGGGTYNPGGFTKNFRWTIYIADEMIGNVYTFVIYAETKTGIYPVEVDFRIAYEGEHYLDHPVSKVMYAQEAGFKTPEFDNHVYKNSDGGTGSYYSGVTNGTGLLDGGNFKYDPDMGYWRVWDRNTQTYGPILCASITAPCAYYEESLNNIESHGNKNLTVSDGTENYKQFIESSYAAACNSDGVCYVTMELMEFLQKFSISQRLFIDGNGFVESTGVYAIEEDQWLFCCGYYEEIA